MADIEFTDFAFPATGSPTARTMPTRLGEIKNIKDFGAVGDGATNDAPAIQAAIDSVSGPDKGTIYFPTSLSSYAVNSEILLNHTGPLSIIFKGEGLASKLQGNFNGTMFKRSLASPVNNADILFDNVVMSNSGVTGGALRMGSCRKVALRDCQIGAYNCYTCENTEGGLQSTNTFISSSLFTRGGPTIVGSRGIVIAGGAIEGTDVRSFDVAYRIAGTGTTIWGGRSEANNTSMEFGVGTFGQGRGVAADIGAKGVALIGHTWEANWYDLDFVGTTEGFYGSGLYLYAHEASSSGAQVGIQDGLVGVRIRPDKLKGAMFTAVATGGPREIAGIQVEDPTSRPNIAFYHCNIGQIGGAGVPWIHSTKAFAAHYSNNNEQPIFTFAGLPGVSDRREGDEYDISDSSTAAWGATVSGGGSNRVRVRFNGTNWTVTGA